MVPPEVDAGPDPSAPAPATITPNLFVGAQAQRWLARQHAPGYAPSYVPPPPEPAPPVPAMPATLTANPRVGSQAQRWLARQRNTLYWPVDTPPSYISPVTPPTGPGLVVRGNYGFIGIADGQPDGTYWRMPNFTYLTDSQYIAIVLGDEGGAAAQPTILYFHCNSSFTQGAFLSITFNSFTLGSFTRTDNTITYTPFNNGSVSMLLLSAQTVGVQNINNAYTVVVNGQPMLEFTGGSVAMGPSFRSAAVSMSRFTDNSGFVWDSYRLAALSLADYVQPVHTGTGCMISRSSATPLTPVLTTTGTPALLPNNTFDTIDLCTADITVDLSTNKITVLTAGWYLVTLRLGSNVAIKGSGGTTNATVTSLILAKNGSLFQEGPSWNCGASALNSLVALTATFVLQLDAGDYIQPGNDVYYVNLQTWGIVGPGPYTYMSISLLNQKVG